MKKTLIIYGTKIETKMFRTRSAADNYIKRHPGSELVYFRAHEYYVSIVDCK